MQSEERGAGEKRQRDEQETRVAPPPRGGHHGGAESDACECRGQDEPEVGGVVLPALVDGRLRQHDDPEHGRDESRRDPELHWRRLSHEPGRTVQVMSRDSFRNCPVRGNTQPSPVSLERISEGDQQRRAGGNVTSRRRQHSQTTDEDKEPASLTLVASSARPLAAPIAGPRCSTMARTLRQRRYVE